MYGSLTDSPAFVANATSRAGLAQHQIMLAEMLIELKQHTNELKGINATLGKHSDKLDNLNASVSKNNMQNVQNSV